MHVIYFKHRTTDCAIDAQYRRYDTELGMRRSEKVLKKKREDFQNEEKSFERIIMCEHGSNHGSWMRRKQQRDNNRQQCSSRQQRSSRY